MKKVLLVGLIYFASHKLGAAELNICDVVENRVESGNFPNPNDPQELLFIDDNLFFAKYGPNLFSLHSLSEEPVNMYAAGLLLQNNPTQNRSDILYLFAHGNKNLPDVSDGDPDPTGMKLPRGILSPDQYWKAFIEKSGVNMKDFRAVILFSCYGGSCLNRLEGTSPLSAHLSAYSGLPVAAPTGRLELTLGSLGSSVHVVDFTISDPQTEEFRWSIIYANKTENTGAALRQDALPIEDIRKITGFYKKWEKISKNRH